MTAQIKTPYEAFDKKTADHSDENGFSFGFFCDCCGMEIVSPIKPFSGGNREAERQAAFNEAKVEIIHLFNNCLKCGDWVCDICFLPERGICKSCEASEQTMPLTV